MELTVHTSVTPDDVVQGPAGAEQDTRGRAVRRPGGRTARSADSALVIDLDGVLRLWDPEIIAAAERRHGLPPGALHSAAFADAATLHAVVTGRISDAQWRAAIATQLVARHGETAAGAVADWSEPCGQVDPEVLAVVRRQRRHRPVALLANATDRLPRDLQRLGLDGELDTVFNSSTLGLAKPEPQVFAAVCAALQLPPHRCLFVDDQQANVDAAERVGLRAHLYRGPADLAAFLEAPPWPMSERVDPAEGAVRDDGEHVPHRWTAQRAARIRGDAPVDRAGSGP
jgi:putative hydrolase of the HAD superfamily